MMPAPKDPLFVYQSTSCNLNACFVRPVSLCKLVFQVLPGLFKPMGRYNSLTWHMDGYNVYSSQAILDPVITPGSLLIRGVLRTEVARMHQGMKEKLPLPYARSFWLTE
jgi:hypothetical protein